MVEGGLRFRFEGGAASIKAPLATRGPMDPPRYAPGNAPGVQLRLQGAGEPSGLGIRGARASLRHSAGIEEIWDNDERGLEQTFRVEGPLDPASNELRLRIKVDGARAQLQGTDVELHADDGARLRYGDLAVVDAKGRRLPSHFAIAGAEIHIVVDAREASYPIVVDPSLRSLKSPVARVSVPGGAQTIAFVGDVNKDGFADVAVGVPTAAVSGKNNAGEVRLFFGSATGLPTVPSLVLQGTTESQRFGCGLAGAGDSDGDGYAELLIGSCGFNGGQVDEGRVDLYKFGPGTPALKAESVWHYESNVAGLKLGSVIAAGDFDNDGANDIVIGIPGAKPGAGVNAGSVLLFKGNKNPATIGTTPSWTFDGDQAGANVGFAVAAAGDVDKDGFSDLLVAAPNYDLPSALDAGRVYLFRGSATGPSSLPAWSADGVQPGAHFGFALAGRGDVNNDGYADIAIGAPDFDAPGLPDAGAVLVFHGGPDGLAKAANTTITGKRLQLPDPAGVASARLGGTLSFGDINGDKHSDLLAGYARVTQGGVQSAALYLGSCNGLIPSSVFRAGGKDKQNGIALVPWIGDPDHGRVVVSGTDLNKDGYDDMLFSSSDALGLNSFWDQDLDGEDDLFEAEKDPRAPTSFDTDGDGCDDGTETWYGPAGDATKFPAGCAGGSFGSDAKLTCPQLTPIYVEEGPLAGTCVPCSVDANPACKGGFPGAFASGALNACPSDKAPLCVTTGALRGSCAAACTGPASCTDALAPVCNTQTGRCVGCDGDFGTGSPAACPSQEAPSCAKDGIAVGACTGAKLKPTATDAGTDSGSGGGTTPVGATPPDLSGCSACAVGQAPAPKQGLLSLLGSAFALLAFVRRRRR
jgi:hypothetical protein